MAQNIKVSRKDKESDASLLRRFSREVRIGGMIKAVKGLRFYSRKASKFTRKKSALEKIKRTNEYEEKKKLGLLG